MEPILKLVIQTLDAHQADLLNVIDIHNYNPLTTYFVIATANNPRLANALVDYVEEALVKDSFPVHHIERAKDSEGEWTLIDAFSCVIHIFTPSGRTKYNLDGLWRDTPHVDVSSLLEPHHAPTTFNK